MPVTLLSNGVATQVLNTTSAGVVTGSTFALPQSDTQSIAWTLSANGSAISTTVETSNDNSAWTALDSSTANGTKTTSSTAKFIRFNQVSRTGGTSTTITVITSRSTGGGTGSTVTDLAVSGKLSLADGTALLPSLNFTSKPTTGIYKSGTQNIGFTINGIDSIIFSGNYPTTSLLFGSTGPGDIKFKQESANVLSLMQVNEASYLVFKAASLIISNSSPNNSFATDGGSIIGAQGPTITSGFGTSPSIVGISSLGFLITIGTGGSATQGVLGNLRGVANKWIAMCVNLTAAAGHRTDQTYMIASTNNSLTLENQNRSTGAAAAWTAGDLVYVIAAGS